MDSFYSTNELKKIGFKKIGNNVLISRKSSFYSPERILIGNNVRIDDFCILSGVINIGNFVHIASFSACYGGNEGIFLGDFSGLSSRVSIYSSTDDYSGESLTNPTIPEKYKSIQKGKVVLNKHVIVGTNCVILPNIILAEGSSFGAMSLIVRDSEPWSVNAGIPAKKIKNRKKNILDLEKQFLSEINNEKK